MASRWTSFRLFAGVIGLALIPGAAAGLGTLDQQQTATGSSGYAVGLGLDYGQTFTTGATGSLTEVDLLVGTDPSQGGTVSVQIRTVDGEGRPTSNVLATTSLASSQLPSSTSWVTFAFATPAEVVAGAQYAIILRAPDNVVGWEASSSNPYAGGALYASPDGAPYVPIDNYDDDGTFRTYVTPPPSPQCGGLTATKVGTAGNDTLSGTDGVDVIAGLGGDDTIKGLLGNDIICGGDGTDTIDGGSGADKLYGDAGNDTVNGGSGDDSLDGGSGADQVNGGSDKDNLIGGTGSPDKCDGGSGTDSGGSGCETRVSLP